MQEEAENGGILLQADMWIASPTTAEEGMKILLELAKLEPLFLDDAEDIDSESQSEEPEESEFLKFLDSFSSTHRLDEEALITLFDEDMETATQPEHRRKLIARYTKVLKKDYLPNLAHAFLTYIQGLVEIGAFSLEHIGKLVDQICEEYGFDVSLGSEFHTVYRQILKADKEIPNRQRLTAIKDSFSRQFDLLIKGHDQSLAELGNFAESDPSLAKFVEDQNTKARSNLLVLSNMQATLEDISPATSHEKKFALVKELISGNLHYGLTVQTFERFLTNIGGSPHQTDLWNLYAKFALKNQTALKYPKVISVIFRAAQSPIDNTNYIQQALQIGFFGSGKDPAVLEEAFQTAWRISSHFGYSRLSQLRIFETYFKLCINAHGSKTIQSTEEVEIDSLRSILTYIDETISAKESLSYDERSTLVSIYKGLIDYSLRLPQVQDMTDLCEKIVALAGNDQDNWLYYTQVLKRQTGLKINDKTQDPIRSIYHRGLRFCKGDTSRIKDSYHDYEMMYGQVMADLNKIKEEFAATTTKPAGNNLRAAHLDVGNAFSSTQAQKKNNMRDIYKDTEKTQKTVFLNGLPPEFQKQDLLDILPNPQDVLDVRIIRKPNATTQIAYVDFNTKEAAEAATVINKQNFGGYNVAAAISKPPESQSNDRTVLITKLPHEMKSDQLHKELKFCKDDIESMRVHKSAAHITFKTVIAAKRHLKRLKNMEMGVAPHRRRIIAVYQGEKQTQDGQRQNGRKDSTVSSQLSEVNDSKVARPSADAEPGLGKRVPETSLPNLPTEEPRSTSIMVPEAAPVESNNQAPVPPAAPTKTNKDFRKMFNLK